MRSAKERSRLANKIQKFEGRIVEESRRLGVLETECESKLKQQQALVHQAEMDLAGAREAMGR